MDRDFAPLSRAPSVHSGEAVWRLEALSDSENRGSLFGNRRCRLLYSGAVGSPKGVGIDDLLLTILYFVVGSPSAMVF